MTFLTKLSPDKLQELLSVITKADEEGFGIYCESWNKEIVKFFSGLYRIEYLPEIDKWGYQTHRESMMYSKTSNNHFTYNSFDEARQAVLGLPPEEFVTIWGDISEIPEDILSKQIEHIKEHLK